MLPNYREAETVLRDFNVYINMMTLQQNSENSIEASCIIKNLQNCIFFAIILFILLY